MTFSDPPFLFALLAIPFVAAAYLLFERRRAKRSIAWSRQALLPNIVERPTRRLSFIPLVLFLVGLAMLLVGFARPQRVIGGVHGGAATIVLAVDVSGSMAAHDLEPSRIRAAQAVATQFLNELPARYQVSLVTFGNKVRVVVPPTADHKRVIANLPKAVTPLSGTSLGDAISASLAIVVQTVGTGRPINRTRPGAVLLISDGAQTAGGANPADATANAFVDGIPVDTITFGTPGGFVTQPVQVDGLHSTIQIGVPALPLVLSKISQQTGGLSFDVASTAQLPSVSKQLPTVYKNLRPDPRATHTTHQVSAVAGGIALVFMLAGVLLSGLWFGRVA